MYPDRYIMYRPSLETYYIKSYGNNLETADTDDKDLPITACMTLFEELDFSNLNKWKAKK